MKKELKLRTYQVEGVQKLKGFIRNLGAAYLCDEMGLGKTAQAATLAAELPAWQKWHEERGAIGQPRGTPVKFSWEPCKKVLVVCPASLRINWQRELKMWAPHLEAAAAIRSGAQAAKLRGYPVVICSYDLTVKEDVLKVLTHQRWDYIIFDEAHYLKNQKAKRTKACLEKLWPLAMYRLCLSGTPIPNGVTTDGYTLFHKIHPELFPNFHQYANRYAKKKRDRFARSGWKFYGGQNISELRGKVRSSFMVRRLKADVLKELPGKIFTPVYVKFRDSVVEDFSREEEEALRDYAEGGDNPSGLLNSEHMAEIRRGTGLLKAPKVAAYVRDAFDEKNRLVIFAHHTGVIEAIQERLQGCWDKVMVIDGSTPVDTRQKYIDEFQSDDASRAVLIGQIQAAGVGITLTKADTCLFAEMPWTEAELSQAIDRLHRIGQESTVNVHYILAERSLDEYIVKALQVKSEVTQELMG